MEKSRVIILGPQCSGKTTLVRYLREHYPDFPIMEEDEAFVRVNGGTYPQDVVHKENVLRKQLEDEIRNAENLIYITSYCSPELLKELKLKGFKIVQLTLDREKLIERNQRRMVEEGYDDVNPWLDENLKFHQEMRDQEIVDEIIDTDRPIEVVTHDLINFLNT